MGDLQNKILDHMIECPSNSENTNHISKALGLSRSTIFESVQLLEKGKYVQSKQEYLRGRRTLTLTDKGAAAALFSGKEKNKIRAYLRRHAPSSSLLMILDIIKDKNVLDSKWIKLFIDYYLLQGERKGTEDIIASLIAGPKENSIDPKKLEDRLEHQQLYPLVIRLQNKIDDIYSVVIQLISKTVKESTLEFPGWALSLDLQKETESGTIYGISTKNLQLMMEWVRKLPNCQLKVNLNVKDKRLEFTPFLTY